MATTYVPMDISEEEFNKLSKNMQKKTLKKHHQKQQKLGNKGSGQQSYADKKERNDTKGHKMTDHFDSIPKDKKGVPLIQRKVVDFPNGYRVYQYSVVSINNEGMVAKWGCDDATYLENPELVCLVPRSYSVITYTDEDDNERIITRTMGLPKFGALLDLENGRSDAMDEDNDSTALTGLSAEDMKKKAISVIEMEKGNGKFCLISAFQNNDNHFIVVGSKGVHKLIPMRKVVNEPNVEYHLPETNPSFMTGLIGEIYDAFKIQYNPSKHSGLIEHLFDGHALVGEFTDGKHMIPLKKGEKPYIEFFGISNNDPKPSDLTGDILQNIKILEDNGLRVLNYKEVTIDKHFKANNGRYGRNIEGRVDYYLNANGLVVGMAKYKTFWYILIRMLRQIILNGEPSNYKKRIMKTIIARNSFLHFPQGYLSIWYDLLCRFTDWFVSKGYDKNAVGIQDNSIGMGNLWAQFLEENPVVSDEHLPPLEEMKKRGVPEDTTFKITFENKLVVILQGIPGIGKNAIADYLAKILRKRVSVLDQDRYAHLGKKVASQKCRDVFKELLGSGDYDVIILARNNAITFQYTTYLDMAQDALWKTVVVRPEEVDTSHRDELIAVCIQSVLERDDHPTMNGTPEKRLEIVSLFSNWLKSEIPQVSSTIHFVDTLSYLKESTEFDPKIETQISQAIEKGTPLPVVNGTENFRRTIKDIASSLNDIIEKHISEPVPDFTPIKEDQEPLYYGLFPPSEMKEWLKTVIKEMDSFSKKTARIYIKHLTLMHKNGKTDNPKLWDMLKKMVADDETLKLEIYGYVVRDKDTIVILARVKDMNGEDKSSEYVFSGFPHITGVLPKQTPAYESVNILKGLLKEDRTYENEVLFDTPMTYDLKVKAHSA